MKVLGICGRDRHAAAALAVDGVLVAASSEDCFTRVSGIGYRQTGGFPSGAVQACLDAAALQFADVDQLTIVDDEQTGETAQRPSPGATPVFGLERRTLPQVTIGAIEADAVHTAVSDRGARAVLVCSTQPPAIASFVREENHLRSEGPVDGGARLMSAARLLADRLGVTDHDAHRGLDRLSVGGEPEFQDELADVMRWSPGLNGAASGAGAISVNEDKLTGLLSSICGSHAAHLADASSLNVRLQHLRKAIAASFSCRLAHVVRDAAETVCDRAGLDTVAFGGSAFANPRFTTELRRLMGGQLSVASVPEAAGRALGAALASARDADAAASQTSLSDRRADHAASSLALGPAFSETDIKRTLDNCRLDYMYEPDWRRLLGRVSSMLSQGKVIAWFQGPLGFGPRSMGTRSVLCDPSGRYARHNINEYLRQQPLDEPLPVVFAPSVAERCLTDAVSPDLMVMDAAVNVEWRDRLAAALDWRQYLRVHTVGTAHAPELCDLLEYHNTVTGVPALIETNLGGPGEPPACTPRDAVRTVFSSAIDALVIGRFLLMKDYWLLKSHVG
jgi:predicted NodU family carbamoyl transferase